MQALGADILKIDKFFVDGVETNQAAKVIVQMLVGVAHQLDMLVVAEGIETAGQMAWLKEIGIDHGQGYFVSRPIPTEEFSRLLRAAPNRPRPAPKDKRVSRATTGARQ